MIPTSVPPCALINAFADRGAGSHDIVDNNNPLALQALADHEAALAVVLDLLAVESIADLTPPLLVKGTQLLHGRRAQRDALVGRAEEHVEAPACVVFGLGVERFGVGGGDGADELGVREEAAVEEVGAGAVGFQLEGAEGEDVGGEAEGDEGGFPGGEVSGGHCCC